MPRRLPRTGRRSRASSIGEHHDVPAIFANFLQFFGVDYAGLRISTRRHGAQRAAAARSTRSRRSRSSATPTARTSSRRTTAPWPVDGTTTSPFQFTRRATPRTPASARSRFRGVDATNFPTYVACDPPIAGSANCNQQDADVVELDARTRACRRTTPPPCWYRRLKLDPDTATTARCSARIFGSRRRGRTSSRSTTTSTRPIRSTRRPLLPRDRVGVVHAVHRHTIHGHSGRFTSTGLSISCSSTARA